MPLPNHKGFSVVEALLAGSIFALMVVAFVSSIGYGQESTATAGMRSRAMLLAEEGLEAARNIRDGSFANLTDGNHGLAVSANQWIFSGTQDVIDIFTRQVAIASVDADRKDVISTITWQQTGSRGGSLSLVERMTNWLDAAGAANWVFPVLVSTLNISGNNDGLKVWGQGNYAYMVRDDGTPDFIVADVSDPLVPTLAASLNLTGIPTNIVISGSFAYVSSRDNSQELQIINIANPLAPTVAGTFNATGNADGLGVFAIGSTVYLVRDTSANDEFIIINAAVPAAPVLVGSLNLNAAANEVAVVANNAFIASRSDTQELQIVDITTPALPTLVGSFNVTGTSDALTIAAFGSTAVIGQADGLFRIFNVTTPASPTLTSSFNAINSINDISMGNSNNYAFIATSDANAEFKVVNMTTQTAPVLLGSINTVDNTLFGIYYDTTKDRAYAAGNHNTHELSVFAPQ